MRQPIWRVLPAVLAAWAAWWVGFQLTFMQAQGILGDPSLQSEKFLRVFLEIEPIPRVSMTPWLLPAAFFVFGAIQAIAFHAVRPALAQSRWLAGLGFGVLAWALCYPWFEFYLPWNVMHEPALLVGLELALWLALTLMVGLAISFAYGTPKNAVR